MSFVSLQLREINPNLLYGYIPTEWICALYVTLFSLSTLLHTGQALYYRIWWLFPSIILGGIGEILGWSARLWSSQTFMGNSINPYIIQIIATIVSPTPILAANFIIIGILINNLGPQYSRLRPKRYTVIFLSADVIALITQLIGGGAAAKAVRSGKGNPSIGGRIMLAGIVFQLLFIIIFSFLSIGFVHRYVKDRPVHKDLQSDRGLCDSKEQLMLLGLFISTFCMLVRGIYRSVELGVGWKGDVIRTQVWFNIFDAAMIVIAIYAMNVFHPGLLLNHIGVGKARARKSDTDKVSD